MLTEVSQTKNLDIFKAQLGISFSLFPELIVQVCMCV